MRYHCYRDKREESLIVTQVLIPMSTTRKAYPYLARAIGRSSSHVFAYDLRKQDTEGEDLMEKVY